MTPNEFIKKVAPIVMLENSRRGYPLHSSVVIAQGALETGWGKSKIMMKANAIFGIKATTTWEGKVYNAKTSECYDGINYTEITSCFRAYDSLEESIKDYFDLICNLPRYKKAIHSDSARECITAIKEGGYATSPSYIENVMTIINQYNLVQYDSNCDTSNKPQTTIHNPQCIKYIVKSGDTLSEIAKKHGTSWSKLASDNEISNPNLILSIKNISAF